MDKKGNDLRYAVKFENHVKNKNNFFIKQNISCYLNHLRIQLPQHFFAEADTKKHRYALAKASAFADCQGQFRMLLHAIISRNIAYTQNYIATIFSKNYFQLHFRSLRGLIFQCTQSVILDFCFILVASNTVIWPSLFGLHKFKLKAEGFTLHVTVLST